MSRLLFVISLLPAIAGGAAVPIHEVKTDCPVIANQLVPEFRNGYVFRLAPEVMACAPDGHFLFYAPMRIPDVETVSAIDVAVDSDGTSIVAVYGIVNGRPKRFGLVTLDGRGVQTGFIDTGDFWPGHVAVAGDHAIWLLGAKTGKGDYMILRQYSRAGKLTGSYLPRSTFAPGLAPGGAGAETALVAAGQGLAVVAHAGATGNLKELIQLDQQGAVLGRMQLDSAVIPARQFVFTSDEHLYGWGHDQRGNVLALFDVAKSRWQSMEAPDSYYRLFGAEGENLIYEDGHVKDGKVNVAWFKQPAEED